MQMKILRKLHLWLALASALLLLCICLSGALLVYGHEIQHALSPKEWRVIPASQQRPLSRLVTHIEETTQAKVSQIRMDADDTLAWQVFLSDRTVVNLNPYTGALLKHYRYENTFYGWVMGFHRWLLYSDEKNEKPLRSWVSVSAVILITEMLLGVWLWLKPKNPLRRLKINWRARPKVLLYQLHICLGVVCALPVLLIAFSGISFHWKSATQAIIEGLALSQIEQATRPEVTAEGARVSLDTGYRRLQENLDGGQLRRLYLPTSDNAIMSARIKLPGEFYPYSWRWLNMHTGELAGKHDAVNLSAAGATWNFRYVFHIGSFGGHATRVIWILLSLLPVFFIVSGLYLYLKRRR